MNGVLQRILTVEGNSDPQEVNELRRLVSLNLILYNWTVMSDTVAEMGSVDEISKNLMNLLINNFKEMIKPEGEDDWVEIQANYVEGIVLYLH